MALVNAFSSLSLAAPKAAGLGFKKAVSAFVAPPARVGAGRSAVFAVEAKQNKKARVVKVRSAAATAPQRARTVATSAHVREHAHLPAGTALGSHRLRSRRAERAGSPGDVPKPSCGFFEFSFFFFREGTLRGSASRKYATAPQI